MTQVNHSESDMMAAEKVGIFAIKADEQRAELVNPGETPFTGETLPVNRRVEQAFTSALGLFAVARVFRDVGNKTLIEAHFTGIPGIEGAVGIEPRPSKGQPQPVEGLESGLKRPLQTKGIMVIARHHARRGHHKAIGIGDRQEVAGFGAFARLVGHTFAAFLSKGVAAIQVQLRQIEFLSDRLDAVLPHPFEAAVGTPFLEVVVDRLPTNLFFSGWLASSATGSCVHWQPVGRR